MAAAFVLVGLAGAALGLQLETKMQVNTNTSTMRMECSLKGRVKVVNRQQRERSGNFQAAGPTDLE